MHSIHADGTFDWASGAGYTGCSRIRFDGDTYEIVDLWYKDEGYSYGHYYVDGQAVTKEQYDSVAGEKKNVVQWVTWC